MSRKRPYCDVFEGEFYIAQENGLNLCMNTKAATDMMLQLLSENDRLRGIIERASMEANDVVGSYVITDVLNEVNNTCQKQ